MILKDKISVITGGATGIGKATVETFALQGATVIFCDVNKNEGEKTQKELHKKGLKTYFVKADVSKEKDIINLYKYVTKNFKGMKVIAYCKPITVGFYEEKGFEEVHKITLVEKTIT